ncbi:Low molecular weight protein-tyrosine-phosphatase [uncultured Gammaproteobacteria bacterium]
MIRVLFVCTGNICRSPTAEGVFRHQVAQAGLERRIEADSVGTRAYHIGQPPDPRTVAAALVRGYDLAGLRGRQIVAADFDRFDLVLALDVDHRDELRQIAPPQRRERVRLLLDFAPETGHRSVPDPYYGGPEGFDLVLDLVEAASRGLLAHLREQAGAH